MAKVKHKLTGKYKNPSSNGPWTEKSRKNSMIVMTFIESFSEYLIFPLLIMFELILLPLYVIRNHFWKYIQDIINIGTN